MALTEVKKVLLSFVGTNDAGKLISKEDGAILTALKNERFSEVILLWNNGSNFNFHEITKYLKHEITERKLSEKVTDIEIKLKDVTDHNEIYSALKLICDDLPKSKKLKYTAAISSGTPAMQVCWILLAESSDFSREIPLRLIKVRDPKFGKPVIEDVKLQTSLPKIIRLEDEIDSLKKDLVPNLFIDIKRGRVFIGEREIPLSPIELSYYRYFAQNVINGKESEKFSGIFASQNFLQLIYKYHEESFPDLDLNRIELKKLLDKKQQLMLTTFRGNISKLNKKIKRALGNETLSNYFKVAVEGKRGAKFYEIKLPIEKIIIS